MSSRKSWIFLILLSTVGGVLVLAVMGAVAYDTHLDRQHTVTFAGPVRVFVDDFPHDYERTDVIATLDRNDHATVLRIWYGKDYQAIKIRLADGRTGYLISGESGDYVLHDP